MKCNDYSLHSLPIILVMQYYFFCMEKNCVLQPTSSSIVVLRNWKFLKKNKNLGNKLVQSMYGISPQIFAIRTRWHNYRHNLQEPWHQNVSLSSFHTFFDSVSAWAHPYRVPLNVNLWKTVGRAIREGYRRSRSELGRISDMRPWDGKMLLHIYKGPCTYAN